MFPPKKDIIDQTFMDYVLWNADRIGMLVTSDTTEAQEFYTKNLKDATTRLNNLKNLSDTEIEELINKEFQEKQEYIKTTETKMIKLREKYESLLKQTEEWIPPVGDEYELFKEHIINQLITSIKCDIHESTTHNTPIKLSIEQWRNTQLLQYQRDIEFCSAKLSNEINSIKHKRSWLKNIQESLTS